MKYIIICITFICSLNAYADIDVNRLCNAIYKAEGGEKATYLYGIKSIPYNTSAEARQICINSIKNNIKRWQKAGCPGDFITFMGNRYCPPSIHKLNKYWVKNVKYFYEN